jgi:hypothetical protein
MLQNLYKLNKTMFQSHLQLWGDGEAVAPGGKLKSFCSGDLRSSGGCLCSSASCLRCCYRGVLCRHGDGSGVSSGQLHVLQIFLYLPRSEKGQYTLIKKDTDKKENQIFLLYKEIQNGAVAKSYMTNGLLIYGEIFVHFLIY